MAEGHGVGCANLHAKFGCRFGEVPLPDRWRLPRRGHLIAELQLLEPKIPTLQSEDLDAQDLAEILAALPRANHLPASSRITLDQLFQRAFALGDRRTQQKIFAARFGVRLDDVWTTNRFTSVIQMMWNVMSSLPSVAVDASPTFRAIHSATAGAGFYDPATAAISVNPNFAQFEVGFSAVLRHEIGHTVHEARKKRIDADLEQRFGWREYDPNDVAQLDAWIDLALDGATLTATERGPVRDALRSVLGPGQSLMPSALRDDIDQTVWMRKDFGPRLAFVRTKAKWWEHRHAWHRNEAGTLAFFLNYWYARLTAVSTTTLALVDSLQIANAAMSQREFFAELFAFHTDPRRNDDATLDADTRSWLTDVITSPRE